MIVEIPGREDLRIAGTGNDWQVQSARKSGKNAGEWFGTNFFPTLESAMVFVYEEKLRDVDRIVFPADVPAECSKTKESLIRAVRKAVG